VLWDNASTGALMQDTATAQKLNGRLVIVDPFISLDRKGNFHHDLRTRFQTSQNIFPEGGENDSEAFSFLADYKLFISAVQWLHVTVGAFENYSKITSSFYGNHSTLNLAAYGQVDIFPFPRLKMTGGARLEYFSLNGVDDEIVPLFRMGLNYRLKDYTFLRASFGQGYRYPSIAEKFAATSLGSVRIVPNPDVLPESGWSSEAGIKQGIAFERGTGFLDIAFFYSRNSEMIEYLFGIYPVDESSFSYGFKATNIENSRVIGTEISFSVNREGRFFRHSLNGGYNYIYPVEINDNGNNDSEVFLKYRRKHSVKTGYTGNFRNWGWGFDLVAASKILRIDEVFLNELTRESLLPGFFDYWNTSNNPFLKLPV
jgi:iron complex outermembrane receptor protein